MASFKVTTADIQDDELALEEEMKLLEEKKKLLNMKKLRKEIQDIEEIIKALPGLKAQLKELEGGSSSSSSSSPGESKTEAPPATAPKKDVSFGVNIFVVAALVHHMLLES